MVMPWIPGKAEECRLWCPGATIAMVMDGTGVEEISS